MAFTVSEDKKISLGGFFPGLAVVFGKGTATGVTTGILNAPSTDYPNGYGIRKILTGAWGTNMVSGTGVSAVVKSYDSATYDSDILTVTCTAGDVFTFWYIGEDNGEI